MGMTLIVAWLTGCILSWFLMWTTASTDRDLAEHPMFIALMLMLWPFFLIVFLVENIGAEDDDYA